MRWGEPGLERGVGWIDLILLSWSSVWGDWTLEHGCIFFLKILIFSQKAYLSLVMGSVSKSLSFPTSGQWLTNLINMDVYTSRKSLSFPRGVLTNKGRLYTQSLETRWNMKWDDSNDGIKLESIVTPNTTELSHKHHHCSHCSTNIHKNVTTSLC